VLGVLAPETAAPPISAWDGAMAIAAGEIENCHRFRPARVDRERV
jgi:hypothetical protein